jgi:hypothetical protein
VPVLGHHHALGGHRQDLPVAARDLGLAIHRGGTGDQPRRIDHVLRAAWVHHQPRIGQLLHERTRAAGMVQVHMGQDQPIDVGRLQPGLRHAGQQVRQRMAGAAVDEGASAVLHDEVRRIEMIALERGVDGMDAMFDGHLHNSHGNRLRS